MNRHEQRVQIVFAIYQHLLLSKSLNETFSSCLEQNNEYITSIYNDLLKNEDKYIESISTHLKNWTFDRLPYIDQAIMVEAYSEANLGINNKNIIIDEAIRIAKVYSDETSFKYINGVLDNL